MVYCNQTIPYEHGGDKQEGKMKSTQQKLTHQLNAVMQTPISRREFLRYLGVGLLGVVGITGLLNSLGHAIPNQARSNKSASAGYGSGAYGE